MKKILFILLALVLAAGITLPVATPVSANTEMMFYLGMNADVIPSGPFSYAKVRSATYLALDRNAIAVSQGGMKVVSIVNPSIPNPNVDRIYDPVSADQLLLEASYPDGFVTTLTTTPDLMGLAVIIRNYLLIIGIDAQIVILDPTAFFSQLQARSLPFFLTKTPVDNLIFPPEILGRLLLSTSPQNFTGYNNNTFDTFYNNEQYMPAENCAFGPGGLPIVPLYYSMTTGYTIRVQAVCPSLSPPPLPVPGVQVDWSIHTPPPASGTPSGTLFTPFNLYMAIDGVTLTAPLTHSQDLEFFVFKQWAVGTPPSLPSLTTDQRTVVFTADADKLATAQYQQITDLGPVMPLRAFNEPGLDHTVSVDIGIPVAGIEVTFRRAYMSPPNAQIPPFPPVPPTDISIGTAATNAKGVASITYTSNVAGIDQVYAFIDVNEDGQYQEGEPRSPYPMPMNGLKYWLENFMTGGGHIKDGKGKPAWTFSGNAGLVGDIINGEFQIVNHKSKISYHTENFTFLNFFGPEGESPYASNNLVVFHAAFSNNKDNTQIVLFVVITDNGEPGKTDGIFIRVINPDGSWGECWVGTPSTSLPSYIPQSIDGGNFQIHNIK
jgi:hypothetical protein